MRKLYIKEDTAIKGTPVYKGNIVDCDDEADRNILLTLKLAEEYDPEKHDKKEAKEKK